MADALKSGSLHQLNSRVWAFSSAWLERFPDKEEVSGSSPLRPTNRVLISFTDLISEQSLDKVAPLTRLTRGPSSIGRAPPLQGGG